MIKNLLNWPLFRGIAIAVIVAFVSAIPLQTGYAQVLSAPGQMVSVSSPLTPTLMMGLKVDLKDPFNLYFIMSNGEKTVAEDLRKEEYERLIKYFMAALITPNRDMWVNLSPKEADRIIPDNFSMTEMGRDLLAQDYLLKQFTSSLMYPEGKVGKEFWEKIYQKAYQQYGSTDVPVDTFNKVWITPDRADIYQKDDTAFLVASHLKVMMEQDFIAMHGDVAPVVSGVRDDREGAATRQLASNIVRDVIIPVIEKEVNEGANFAQVRQAYHSMILATWFKKALKDSLLGQVYTDQNKVTGIALNDPQAKERIYDQYLQAYKMGVFNYIKEEFDTFSQETLPRRYFAGGMMSVDASMINTNVSFSQAARKVMGIARALVVLGVALTTPGGVPLAVQPQKKGENEGDSETVIEEAGDESAESSETAPLNDFRDLVRMEKEVKRLKEERDRALRAAQEQAAQKETENQVRHQQTVRDLQEKKADLEAAERRVERLEQQLQEAIEQVHVVQAAKDEAVRQDLADLSSTVVGVAGPGAIWPQALLFSDSRRNLTVDRRLRDELSTLDAAQISMWKRFVSIAAFLINMVPAMTTVLPLANLMAEQLPGKNQGPVQVQQIVVQPALPAGTIVDRWTGIKRQVTAADATGFRVLGPQDPLIGNVFMVRGLGQEERFVTMLPGMAVKEVEAQGFKQQIPFGAQAGINGKIVTAFFMPARAQEEAVLIEGEEAPLTDDPDGEDTALDSERRDELQSIQKALSEELPTKLAKVQAVIQTNNVALVALQADLAKPVAAVPVVKDPGEVRKYIEDEQKRIGALTNAPATTKNMPVNVGVGLLNYNQPFLAQSLWTGGAGLNFYLAPDHPGKSLTEAAIIVQGLGTAAGVGVQGTLAQVLGPARLVDIALEIRNYGVLHPNRNQTKLWHTDRTVFEAFMKTLLINWTPVEAANQENVLQKKTTYSVGVYDTVRAVPGFMNWATGDYIPMVWGFFGDLNKRFPFENVGCVLEYGMYQKAFYHYAANKPVTQDNLVFFETFEVTDPDTKYVPNTKNGYDQNIQATTNIHYKGEARGYMVQLLPDGGKMVREVYASPAFITDSFIQAETGNVAADRRSVVIRAIGPIASLDKELAFLDGKTSDGKTVYGGLRHPVTGEMVGLVTNLAETVNFRRSENGAMYLPKDMGLPLEEGAGAAYVPRTAMQEAGAVIVDYGYDELMRPVDEVRHLFGKPRTVAEAAKGINMNARPTSSNSNILARIEGAVKGYIFEPGAMLRKIQADGENTAGWIRYPGTGVRVPIDDISSLTEVQFLEDHELALIGARKLQDGIRFDAHGKTYYVSGRVMVQLPVGGKAFGLFDPSRKTKEGWALQAPKDNQALQEYHDALENRAGVAVDVVTGEKTVVDSLDGFMAAKYIGPHVAGQEVTVKGQRKPVTITAETMVTVDKDGKVTKILELGKKSLKNRAAVLRTLVPEKRSDPRGWEVENKETGKPLIFAPSNNLSADQIEAGILPERDLVALMAANRIEMVQVDGQPEGVKRMVILASARPMEPGFPVARPGTLAEFRQQNMLAIWQGPDGEEKTQFISIEAVNTALRNIENGQSVDEQVVNPELLARHAKSLIQLGPQGDTAGYMVRMYKGGYQLWKTDAVTSHLAKYYQIIHGQPADDARAPIVEYVMVDQLRADFDAIKAIASQIVMVRQLDGGKPGEMETVRRVYFSSIMGIGQVEIGTRVSDSEELISTLQDPATPAARAFLRNSFDIKGKTVTVVERQSLDGVVQAISGVITPKNGKAASLTENAADFGKMHVQFFPAAFKDGLPVTGKAAIGAPQGERTMYQFSVTRDDAGHPVYAVDENNVVGYTTTETAFKIQPADREALGIGDREVTLAEERDSQHNLMKVFVIDRQTNTEIGSINPLRYGDGNANYYEMAVYDQKGRLVSSLLEEPKTVNAQGGRELSLMHHISTAENQAPMDLDEVQTLVGPLSGELMNSAYAVADEIGLPRKDIKFIPSLKITRGNGQKMSYRIERDPHARVIVYQSDIHPEKALFMVNTKFDGAKPVSAYERTLLGDINTLETTNPAKSRASLEKDLGLNKIKDLDQYRGTLGYEHFGEFVEVTSYRLPHGLSEKTYRDKMLVRYVAAGDALMLDLVKVEQGGTVVRLMQYDDFTLLADSPIMVPKGEVAVRPDQGFVSRVAGWVGHDQQNNIYKYRSLYERTGDGVNTNPDVTFEYSYISGLIVERYGDRNYVFRSLNGIPLGNFSSERSSVSRLAGFFGAKSEIVEREQTGFEIRTMRRVIDGEEVVFRLVREVGVEGATDKNDLQSTLFVNDYPIAEKKGERIKLDTFNNSWRDTARSGVLGAIVRSVGAGRIALGYEADLPGHDMPIDVKNIIEEMESATDQNEVDVFRIDSPAAQQLTQEGRKGGVYRNWVQDHLLKARNFAIPVVGSLILSLLPLLGRRKKKGQMNAPQLSVLEQLEKKSWWEKKSAIPTGLAKKWAIFIASNKSVVVKERRMDGGREAAVERLKIAMRAAIGFFTEEEIDSLAELFRQGKISFDEVFRDPKVEGNQFPSFTVEQVTGAGKAYATDALPLVALRDAFQQGWITSDDITTLMDRVRARTAWSQEAANEWEQLFILVRALLFERIIRGERSLDQAFPDSEVNMYRALVAKGYDDLHAYVLDANNGANEKQRVENYVREKILVPMAMQVRLEMPGFGDQMADFRKGPLENAIVSEFHRYAMMDPNVLPDAVHRHEALVNGEVRYTFDHVTLDKVYNANLVLKHAKPATFRERVVSKMLQMPLSETNEMSLGPVSGVAVLTMHMTRWYISKLQDLEHRLANDPDGFTRARQALIEQFGHHLRFWRGVFATNTWSSLFGGPSLPGLFKRITDPGGRKGSLQPDVKIKEIFHDEKVNYLFRRLQDAEATTQSMEPYDALMREIMNNEPLLLARLAAAEQLLAPGAVIEKSANDEKDLQRQAEHLRRIGVWRTEVAELLAKPVANWSTTDRTRAMAIASDSLDWELMTIPDAVSGNDRLKAFVHGPFNQMMGVFKRTTEEFRLKRNSYAYFVHELTGRWNGNMQMWIMRKIVPKIAMGPVGALLARSMGTMSFKASEFDEVMSAENLVNRINEGTGPRLDTASPLQSLNRLVADRRLYQDLRMQHNYPGIAELRAELANPGLTRAQIERGNRRLIELNYPLETPRSIEFTKKDGTRNYNLQNSLEHYFGVKNKVLRGAIVLARTIVTPAALALAVTGGAGLGVLLLSSVWFLPQLLFGNAGAKSEKSLWLSVWAMATGSTALFSHLVIAKMTGMALMAGGTYATLGILALLVPFVVMFSHFITRAYNTHRVYQNNIWSKTWQARTVGWESWKMLRPIRNVPAITKKNFSGRFYGDVLAEILEVQRTRGAILPLGRLVQDKMIDDLDGRDSRVLFSPAERKALKASVTFIALYRPGMKKGDPEWDRLYKAAREYEEALSAGAQSDVTPLDLESISEEDLVALKRPTVFIDPRSPDAKKILYITFETLSMKLPTEDSFARLQPMSTHEHSFNETVTISMETYGRLGTHDIAGVKTFMPRLQAAFGAFLQGKPGMDAEQIKRRDEDLLAAGKVADYPFTTANIVKRFKDSVDARIKGEKGVVPTQPVTQEELEWLREQFAQGKENLEIAETSLIGFCLRTFPAQRDNMLESLVAEDAEAFTDFKAVLEKLEDTDDVALAFQAWAVGRSRDVIVKAQEAVNEFMNHILGNNLSVVKEFSEDILNMHLSAAWSYGDFEYYDQALKAFRIEGSLFSAYEKIADGNPEFAVFKQKFKFYQRSAKLKTVGLLQYVLAWSSVNEFRLTSQYEKQEDFDEQVVRLSEYGYLSKAAEGILALKNSPLGDKFRAVLTRASEDPQSGVKYVSTKDGTRSVVLSREMRDMARLFLEFRKDHLVEIVTLENATQRQMFSDIYEIMEYVEQCAVSEAIIPFYDKRKDDILTANKNGMIALHLFQGYEQSANMDALVATSLWHSYTKVLVASELGQGPEVGVTNPSFEIWSAQNSAVPGIAAYAVAQETFTNDSQRSMLRSAYGKMIGPSEVLDETDTSPGEDTDAVLKERSENPDVVARHSEYARWKWARPWRSVRATEDRYVSNVTVFKQDPSVFELELNPDVGYAQKLTDDVLFNHYQYAPLAMAMLAVPALQGFSAFAYLAPVCVFVPLTMLGMNGINFQNFFRHWRRDGSVLLMLYDGLKDVIQRFSYYVSMTGSWARAGLLTTNEVYKFTSTGKAMTFGSEDIEDLAKERRLAWVARPTKGMEKVLSVAGALGMTAGAVTFTLSLLAKFTAFAVISPNLMWLGPTVAGLSAVGIMLSLLMKYQHQTVDGVPTAPIPIPVDNVIAILGIASWIVGAFCTTTLGATLSLPYLFASFAILTGALVYQAHTMKAKDADGRTRLRLIGEQQSAMFTPKGITAKVFWGTVAGLLLVAALPIPIPAVRYGINGLLYMIMLASVWKGAFANIIQTIGATKRTLTGRHQAVSVEAKNRKGFSERMRAKAQQEITDAEIVALPQAAPQNLLAAPGVQAAADAVHQAEAVVIQAREAVQTAEERQVTAARQLEEARKARLVLPASEEALSVTPVDLPVEPEDVPQPQAPADGNIEPASVEAVVPAAARSAGTMTKKALDAEEIRLNQLNRVLDVQQDKFAQLKSLETTLLSNRSDTKAWKDAYRSVSTQIRLMEKNDTISRLEKILDSRTGSDTVAALKTEIAGLRKEIKMGANKQEELAQKKRDLSLVLRSSKAVHTENLGKVIEAVAAIPRDRIADLADPEKLERLVQENGEIGDSIRFFAGLTKQQKIAALKMALVEFEAKNVTFKADPGVTGEDQRAVEGKVSDMLKYVKDPVGGIDFNEENLMINIHVDGNGMPLPVSLQDAALMNIPGLMPVIRSIGAADSAAIPALAELLQMAGR